MNTINFTYETYNQLKSEYNLAVKNNLKSFMFLGNELLTAYAKYLLEYLKTIFE